MSSGDNGKAVPAQLAYGDATVEIFKDLGSAREKFEEELLQSGGRLPLTHRCAWARAQRGTTSHFVGLRTHGKCAGGFGIELHRTRALPGHLVMRVRRFGYALTDEVRPAGIQVLVDHVRRHRRILRLHLEVFSRNADVRREIAQVAQSLGFYRASKLNCYAETVAIDLTPEEPQIFAAFTYTARRHIRAIGKLPVAVRTISERNYAPRMKELLKETMERTGGYYQAKDWSELIQFSNHHSELSRLVGLFRTDTAGPESLLAFVWGHCHGDHAEYSTAASTRHSSLRVPMVYAPTWDLIRWAKRNGASWFDFGGVTHGRKGDADPLGGISSFKRFFSKEIITVGDEWIYEPDPMRAGFARAISSGVRWMRSVVSSFVTTPR